VPFVDRQWLNDHKLVVAAVLIVAIAAGAFVIHRQFTPVSRDIPVGQNFYSDDDGKTWFADSAAKAPPFDHGGKLAYEAEVYRCGDGKPFVAYLISYEPDDKAAIEAAAPDRIRYVMADAATRQLVKRPGGPTWVKLAPQTTKEYQTITTPRCPDGSTTNLVPEAPPGQ
jgi:hypothetical protein